MAEALKVCKLEELTLIANQMGDAEVEHMHKALQDGNHSLNKLCLEGNKIKEEKFLQEQRMGKTTARVGECRSRERRPTPSGVKTKSMIAKTASDLIAKKLFHWP